VEKGDLFIAVKRLRQIASTAFLFMTMTEPSRENQVYTLHTMIDDG
jgi:hypothetical protein